MNSFTQCYLFIKKNILLSKYWFIAIVWLLFIKCIARLISKIDTINAYINDVSEVKTYEIFLFGTVYGFIMSN